MAQLAIKGHATRGKEVIEILEMLGGNNPYEYVADSDCFGFYIGNETRNIYYDWFYNFEGKDVTIFTLEEFLEKFPYKVGDKVSSKYLKNYKIVKMEWEDTNNRVIYKLQGAGWYAVNELQPFEEITMKKKLEQITLDIPDGYEFFGINDDNKVVLTKKQQQYPKTYEECCGVLGMDSTINHVVGTHFRYRDRIMSFIKLLICRDAYWKIAGEQMGLGKPWKPDWLDAVTQKYCIYYDGIEIVKSPMMAVHHFLASPTEEMRDDFFENFKELIEETKELL